MLCVSADADVLEVVSAIAATVRPGTLVMDCSTVGADNARKASEMLQARSVAFLDCPVSGGVEGARDARLVVMVGGETDAFARAQPILSTMGATVTHFGSVGSGQAAKATNQIMCAGINQAVTEALAFGEHVVDPPLGDAGDRRRAAGGPTGQGKLRSRLSDGSGGRVAAARPPCAT